MFPLKPKFASLFKTKTTNKVIIIKKAASNQMIKKKTSSEYYIKQHYLCTMEKEKKNFPTPEYL